MSDIKIIPLGGVREFGKNMYAVEVDESIFVLDAGLKYPETEMLGVDFVIPQTTYLAENAERVAGIFLTHGHPDSIGGLPYLLAEVNAPVFASELTVELAKLNVKDYEATKKFNDFHIVNEKTEIDFGGVNISFFSTTHTIPDSLGIVIGTKEGNIVYTGDFKFDPAVTQGYKTNLGRLAEIGSQGVLALLSDSANALSTEQSASENEVAEKIYDVISDWEGRVIVASVAGNLARIQQTIDAAARAGRAVALTGHDMDQIVETARRLGKLTVDDGMIVPLKNIKNYADDEILILEAGRMGEPIRAVADMATGRNKQVKIKEGDLVFAVTSPTVSMETFVAKTENIVYKAGGIMKLLAAEIKVSGHANVRDLQTMIDIMQPKNLIPVQGEYRELEAHAECAMEVGIKPENIFIEKRGDILSYEDGVFVPAGAVTADNIMIDGSGVGDIGSIVLRDRKILSEDGIFIAVITISKKDKKIISRAKVHTRGFVYVKQSRDLIKDSANLVNETVSNYLEKDEFDWTEIKQEIRDALGKYLYEQTKRRPVILPVVMEVRSEENLKNNRKKKAKKKAQANEEE
ncbi:RNase J family beta-CASP ribonuclease [Floricoccus penangensis]|uniref:Ribonuclease J n=1 Tax=Floricoccus penangensis TaxID=1859475 RepID=A0A9Q5P230_9LACT|nr:ribonuclease J [Floricoccus penangensis]OFI47805.1 RNase J family beta-CASP ribonuclease [Floricoccus penangensis]